MVYDPKERKRIVRQMHITIGHKGRDAIYAQIKQRYWWAILFKNVEKAWKSCPKCQMDGIKRQEEIPRIIAPAYPFYKIYIDMQYMPKDKGKKFLMEARYGFIGYPIARPIAINNS